VLVVVVRQGAHPSFLKSLIRFACVVVRRAAHPPFSKSLIRFACGRGASSRNPSFLKSLIRFAAFSGSWGKTVGTRVLPLAEVEQGQSRVISKTRGMRSRRVHLTAVR